MTLGHLIRPLAAEKLSLTCAFVLGDILSFAVQGSPVGLGVTGHSTGATAVILLGLFIQIISFGLFSFIAVVFYSRVLRAPTSGPAASQPTCPGSTPRICCSP